MYTNSLKSIDRSNFFKPLLLWPGKRWTKSQNDVERSLEDLALSSVLFWRISQRFKVTEVSKNCGDQYF